jgi:hypothetical protein
MDALASLRLSHDRGQNASGKNLTPGRKAADKRMTKPHNYMIYIAI